MPTKCHRHVASCFKELQSLFHERFVVLEDAPESLHANTGARCGDDTGASSRRFLRIPASTAPAGANRRSKRRRGGRPPGGYPSLWPAARGGSRTKAPTTARPSRVPKGPRNLLATG